jgi:hypothetical protein
VGIDFQNWRSFQLQDLFEIKYGVNLALNACIESNAPDAVNFVSRTELNNGVSAKVAPVPGVKPQEAGLITVAAGGSVLSTFIQPEPFYSGRDLYVLKSRNEDASLAVKMFLVTVIEANKFKFSYGRQANKSLPFIEIKLPVQTDSNGTVVIDSDCPYGPDGHVPNWQFMEDFIKSLNHKPLTTENKDGAVTKLDTTELVDFNFGKLVSDVYKATAFTKEDLVEVPYTDLKTGDYVRYITRTALDNGCEMLVAREKNLEDDIEAGNAISIGDTTATCFYQSEDFVAGDHMVVVRAEWLNPFTGNFIATLLNRESYRYSYGRAFVMESIKATDLKLPVKRNPDGTPVIDPKKSFHDDGYIPDWQFMEDYMRSLPYGDRIPETHGVV